MNQTLRRSVVAALTLGGVACADASSEYADATFAIVGANVASMQGDAPLVDHMIVMVRDSVIAVVPTARERLPDITQVVDAEGRTVTPGLWDAHVHTLADEEDAFERVFPLMIANGITGMRDMGSTLEALQSVRTRLAESDASVAPRLWAAGPLLDGNKKPWYGDLPLVVASAEEAPGALARVADAGADFYKIYSDLRPEAFAAIASAAAERGMEIAGHVPRTVPTLTAVRSGQRTIEHLDPTFLKDCIEDYDGWFARWLGAKFGPEAQDNFDAYYEVVGEYWAALDTVECQRIFDGIAEAGTYVTPTLGMELNDVSRVDTTKIQYMPEGLAAFCRSNLEKISASSDEMRKASFSLYLETARELRQAGVTLLAGTDTPNNCLVPGFSFHWELARLVEVGLTPYEALRTATVEVASLLGEGESFGVLAEGYRADLVMYEADPLSDINNSHTVTGVLAHGRWFDEAALTAMRAQALEAAARQ